MMDQAYMVAQKVEFQYRELQAEMRRPGAPDGEWNLRCSRRAGRRADLPATLARTLFRKLFRTLPR
ncbi:hypothetical protein [Cohnella fermenti]|uniref:Uncharacterized protein n=1 Tax=Cohnella fermenti TaxID=2565925 RepID=A0A4S4BJF4_9BACL|nr:hypothetical protein [Cohnella fermenti]THF74565.1 hypothetical protein E6C55_24490 [Cohnella fermenti]